jgi:AmmeMemoRadiSam system protein B
MIRPPAVAGYFYPDEPARLTEQIDALVGTRDSRIATHALACLVPHAGYRYSGRVAGAVYSRLDIPPRVILVGPRHHPHGAALAIQIGGWWQTPLGLAPIDQDLGQKILQSCSLLRVDDVAHSTEHSLEVQIPFLQRLAPQSRFVPIVLGPLRYAELAALGEAIAGVILAESEPVLIVASSDMNHYESDEITRVKDRKAIDRMVELDAAGLFDTVRVEDISMCGYAAAATMLIAARKLGATKAELVEYATSGEVNGEMQEVVGYAGMIIS